MSSHYASPLDEAEDADDPLQEDDGPAVDSLIPPQINPEDYGMGLLEAALVRAEAKVDAEREIRHRYVRLKALSKSRSEDHVMERQQLLASIRELEEGIVWTTTAAVAIVDQATCKSCGQTHRFFQGWMTEQVHKRDHTARRLLAGKPNGFLPAKVEYHETGDTDDCPDCVEAGIMIDTAAGRWREWPGMGTT